MEVAIVRYRASQRGDGRSHIGTGRSVSGEPLLGPSKKAPKSSQALAPDHQRNAIRLFIAYRILTFLVKV